MRIAAFSLVTLLMAAPAGADPVTVGSYTATRDGGPISFSDGTLSFSGFGTPMGGLSPINADVRPGETLSLDARWSGMALTGIAALNGTVFDAGTYDLYCEWLASLNVPPSFVGGIVSVPFQFTARFVSGGSVYETLGVGLLTALIGEGDNEGLRIRAFSYDFDTEAAVAAAALTETPEPGALLLVVTGAAMVVRRLRCNGQ